MTWDPLVSHGHEQAFHFPQDGSMHIPSKNWSVLKS